MRRGKWLQQFHEQHGRDPVYLSAKLVRQVMAVMWRRMGELGLTQAGVAERLKVSQPRVAQLMNDTPNLTMRSLVALAGALGLDVEGVRFTDRETGAVYADTGQARRVQWSAPVGWQQAMSAPSRQAGHEEPWQSVVEPSTVGMPVSMSQRGGNTPWEHDDASLGDAA